MRLPKVPSSSKLTPTSIATYALPAVQHFVIVFFSFSDGDPDQKDFCWRFICSQHFRRRQKLF